MLDNPSGRKKKQYRSQSGQTPSREGRWSLGRNELGVRLKQEVSVLFLAGVPLSRKM